MVRPDSPLRRLVCAALVALQVAVLAAFTPLEFAHRDGVPVGAHVEPGSDAPCIPPHDGSRCQVCQAVTLRPVVPVAGFAVFETRAVRQVAGPQPSPFAPRTVLATTRPRAPPTLGG